MTREQHAAKAREYAAEAVEAYGEGDMARVSYCRAMAKHHARKAGNL